MTNNRTEFTQSDKFKDMDRELKADEDETRFEEAARKFATAAVSPKADKSSDRRSS